MASGTDHTVDAALSPAEREWLAAVRTATSLSELVALTDAATEHAAYFAAKDRWRDLRGKERPLLTDRGALPGTCVTVAGRRVCVHGVTHAGTEAEGSFLRDRVASLLDSGARVYCEQGIRSMYFRSYPAVRSMDDYEWAIQRCRAFELAPEAASFDGLTEDLDAVTDRLRDALFELLDGGSRDGLRAAIGDVASDLLASHADLATGEAFESFRRTRAAASDPERLPALQRYYERRFLPQPLEREWLRRHDRELELLTHARNERMADYAVYHLDGSPVHLLVGAAHQPGVRYYLQRHRDGERTLDGFELLG